MDSQLILRALKSALKRKNLTYRDLGARLGLTEAAVKKQFQSSDISFNRILEICRILDISVTALIEAAKSNPIYELELTTKQQSYFLKNPEVFVFFLKLSHANGDLKKMVPEFDWPKDHVWKTLKSLDDLDLIRLHEGNQVKLIYGNILTVATQNTPMSQITQKLGIKFLEKFQHATGNDLGGIKIALLKLSRESTQTLKKDLDRVYRTQLRQSEIDAVLLPEKDLKICSLMIAAGAFSFL